MVGIVLCVVGKTSKDIGMTIRKSVVVSFLLCSVTFFGFPSLYVLSFSKLFFVTCFCCCFSGRETFLAEMCCCKS